eukprot:g7653.t1
MSITARNIIEHSAHALRPELDQGGFAANLYHMLSSCPAAQRSIAWSATGDGVEILDRAGIERDVLPRYFTFPAKFTNFYHQLNRHGFRTRGRGRAAIVYEHPAFRRGAKAQSIAVGMRTARSGQKRKAVATLASGGGKRPRPARGERGAADGEEHVSDFTGSSGSSDSGSCTGSGSGSDEESGGGGVDWRDAVAVGPEPKADSLRVGGTLTAEHENLEAVRLFDAHSGCVIVCASRAVVNDPGWRTSAGVGQDEAANSAGSLLLDVTRPLGWARSVVGFTVDSMTEGRHETAAVARNALRWAAALHLTLWLAAWRAHRDPQRLQRPRVIVHCRNSRSRSPCVLAVFLAVFRGIVMPMAAEWVKQAFRQQRVSVARRDSTANFPNLIKFEAVRWAIEQQLDAVREHARSPTARQEGRPGSAPRGWLWETVEGVVRDCRAGTAAPLFDMLQVEGVRLCVTAGGGASDAPRPAWADDMPPTSRLDWLGTRWDGDELNARECRRSHRRARHVFAVAPALAPVPRARQQAAATGTAEAEAETEAEAEAEMEAEAEAEEGGMTTAHGSRTAEIVEDESIGAEFSGSSDEDEDEDENYCADADTSSAWQPVQQKPGHEIKQPGLARGATSEEEEDIVLKVAMPQPRAPW